MLTRLQMPAGKAVALAAMPTAMLMGMGLTPQLAQADTQSRNGFKPGPCVSKPDEADEEAKAKAKAKAKAEAEEKEKEEAAKAESSDKEAEPKPSASADDSSDDAKDAPEAEESSSSSDSGSDAIDPLGVGSVLGGVLGGEEKETAEPEPEPKASESKDGAGSVTDTVGKVTGSVSDTVKETTEKAGDTVGSTAGGSGAEGYPCPEFDADAFANAEYEDTSSRLPNRPWQLESSMLSLHGLDFKGIVQVRTHDGSLKKVLKFTAKGVDIKDLHQMVEGPGGTTMHVESRKGSTSTIRQGTVTMYTEELKGNLFGIIPIVFSPKMPPPLNIKEVFFTNAKVKQAGQFGGTLTVPGIHSYGVPG